jgi:hypothetical protein
MNLTAARLMTQDEARRIAGGIAKLPVVEPAEGIDALAGLAVYNSDQGTDPNERGGSLESARTQILEIAPSSGERTSRKSPTATGR